MTTLPCERSQVGHPAVTTSGHADGVTQVYAVLDRPTGRGRPRGGLLHAVPGTDRTRSALCGARVGGEVLAWPDALLDAEPDAGSGEPGAAVRGCADCRAVLDLAG
jgi:hypothetical protein